MVAWLPSATLVDIKPFLAVPQEEWWAMPKRHPRLPSLALIWVELRLMCLGMMDTGNMSLRLSLLVWRFKRTYMKVVEEVCIKL